MESLARQQTPISAFYVRQLHALVLAKIDDENAGQYRNLPVGIVGAAHEPPPAWDVSAQMDDWAVWLQEQEGQMEIVAVERSLTFYLEACTPQTAPPAAEDEWIPLRQAADLVPYSQDYLSLLARTGKLEAIKRGRIWHTTRQALAAYVESIGKGNAF